MRPKYVKNKFKIEQKVESNLISIVVVVVVFAFWLGSYKQTGFSLIFYINWISSRAADTAITSNTHITFILLHRYIHLCGIKNPLHSHTMTTTHFIFVAFSQFSFVHNSHKFETAAFSLFMFLLFVLKPTVQFVSW